MKESDMYFSWLIERLNGSRRLGQTYDKLLNKLYNTEFIYLIPLDQNRYDDGLYLRKRFVDEQGIRRDRLDVIFRDKPWCSILEMMTGLAIRCDENIMYDDEYGPRIDVWFWGMIDSMGLTYMNDENYDCDYTQYILERFLNREYSSDGEGGLFTIPNCDRDLRNVEIWYQLCWYLNTLFN